jgi:hypothetical protein
MGTLPATAPSGGADLRPLSLGDLLDRVFVLYRTHFWLFIGIIALPQVIALLSGLAFGALAVGMGANQGPGAGMTLAVVGAGVFGLLYLMGFAASQAATVYAVSDIYLGRPGSWRAAYNRVGPKIGRMIWIFILTGLCVAGGFFLLIIPGIIILCRTWVGIPAALLEDLRGLPALRRSFALTKGDAGRIFVVLLLMFLLAIVAQSVLQFPFQLAATMLKGKPGELMWSTLANFGNGVATILVGPLSLIASAVMYYDLRVRKEAFDLQAMLSALEGGPAGLGAPRPAND